MKHFNIFQKSLHPDNASGMDRHWTDNGPMKLRKFIPLFFMLFALGVGNAWATDFTNATFSFNTSSAPTGWETNGTFNNSYYKFNSGNYAQTTDISVIIPDGEVLSTDMSVSIGCGSFGTWSNPKSLVATVQLLDGDGDVLSSNNATFSSLTGAVPYKTAITVTKPTNPALISKLKIILSDFNSTSTGCARFGGVKLTYSTEVASSGCDKKVTISKGTPSNGDFTLSKTGAQATCSGAVEVVVTPTPAEHYKVTGVTAPNSSSISEPDKDGKYTVTYAQNTNASSQINVTFGLIPSHKAYFYNGSTLLNTGGTSFDEGADVSYSGSTPTSCDTGTGASTTFAGWATATWDGKVAKNDIVPSFYEGALPVMGDDDVTYYAVFCKGGSSNVTLTSSEFHDNLGQSYANATITKTIGGTDYTFNLNACEPNNNGNVCQLKKDAGVYIQIPTLPGKILGLSSTSCSDANDNAYSGTLRLKSTAAAGNTTTNDLATKELSSVTSFSWDISENITTAYLTTSAGLRLSNLTITYGGDGTNYMTTCCQPLAQINGSVNVSQTSAVVKLASAYSDANNADAYQLKVVGSSNYNDWTDVDKDDLTTEAGVTVNGLTCGTQYTAYLRAKGSGSYCATGEESSVNFTTSKYSITKVGEANSNTFTTKIGDETVATACNSSTITLTASPASNYTFTSWSVKDAGDNTVSVANSTASTTTFTMPSSNVTVTATFTLKQCTKLSNPAVSVSGEDEYPFNVTLSWEAVDHADGYTVEIYNGETKIDSDDLDGGAESYDIQATLVANTTYTYKVKATSETPATYCESDWASDDFTTSDYPTVKLFYSENGVLSEGVDKKILTNITLPTEAAECDKQLVGWTTAANASYSHASAAPDPLYAPGKTDFQIPTNANCTLYAVYANVVEASTNWTRVTAVNTLTAGGTFIMGYEADAENAKGTIIPMRNTGSATTSAAGYMYSGTGSGTTSDATTLTMSSVTETAAYEISVVASTEVDDAICIKIGDNFLGNENAKNSCKLYAEEATTTAFSPTIGDDDAFTLDIAANTSGSAYRYMKYNTGAPRFAVYSTEPAGIVFYKKSVTEASTTNYATTCMGKVVKPVITGVAGSTTYEANQTVTITSATDGATIKYTTDGSDPASSATSIASGSSFTLSENGTYTIRAIALKDGMTNSDEATAVSNVTIDKPFTTIASFIAGAPTDKKLVLTGAKVLGVTTNYIYIQDATGGIQLNKSSHGLTFASGKTLSGYVVGTYSNNSTSAYMPRLTFTDGSTMGVTEDAAALPEATVITAGSEANICKLVKLQNVKFQSTSLSSNTVYVQKSDLDIDTVYNTFGVLNQTLPNAATLCDVTGVLIKYNSKYEIAPVSVNGITTNGASAILPTLSTAGSTDSENPTAVAEGKVITITPAVGMTSTYKDGTADAADLTSATNVTIDVDKAIKVTASAYYYVDAEATYYYHADPSLTERSISKASMSNGSVTVKNGDTEVSSAAQGATITLIPVPTFTTTQHYHLTGISVADEDEDPVSLTTVVENEEYTFTMPAKAVTVSATFAEDAKYAITFDGNGNTGGTAPSAISNKYVGTEITLPANSYKKSGKSFAGWAVTETVSGDAVAVANNKFTMPAAAVTITAQWEDLPVWATTYTSNITTTADSKVVPEDEEEYDAWKVNKGSNITLDVPKGTTAIHMHMVAWKGEAANVTISGTCFSANKVIELTANDGISNNSPFTLSEAAGSEFYFSLTPDNAINANTTITISAASNKRLVVFGVNAIFPEITLSPATYDFENVRANQTKSQEFTITKNANVTGTLSASIIDDANGKYSVGSITDGKVTVTFDPDGAESGTFTAKLKIEATNASVTANLTGTAIAALAPEITVDKNVVAFGRVNPNAEVSEDIQIGLLNIEGAVSAALSGDDAEKFELSAESFTENGILRITPITTENGVYAATLTLSATDVTPIEIPLSITVASKWATKYTSNVTVSANENKKVKVGSDDTEYTAPKTNTGATATITLPRGTQKLHLHMVAWKGEGGDVTVSGTCFSQDKTINVPANEDISSTWSSVTFTEKLALSYYHELVLDNVNNNGTTTVSVSKSGSRIVLFGVNQEGGIVEITENTNASTLEEEANIEVKDGVTLTIDANKELDNLTVEAGGTVSGSANLTVNDLTIKTSLGTISGDNNTGGKSGQITNSNITASGDVFIEIELTQESQASYGWYAFSVPFEVDALNGVYYQDTKLTNEVGYAIMKYHEDIRATGEYAWKKYRGIMQPGELYIITVADTDYKTLRFKKHGDAAFSTSTSVAVSKTGDDLNSGWNGLGNPNLQVSYTTAETYMHFLDHEANAFKTREASKVNLAVGSAFFIQYSGDGNSIAMNLGSQSGEGTMLLAPARTPKAVENIIHEVKLINAATNKEEDNVFFTAREEATNNYEIGRDVAKMSMGTANCAQMMIPAYGTNLCAADFPLVNDQVEYPLTITTPAAGEYRIEAAEAYADADIYLTKDGAIIWNLSMSPYEVELLKGTTNEYGLKIVAAPQVITDIEQSTISDQPSVQKVIIDDKVFILRGEQMYDVTGKAVK